MNLEDIKNAFAENPEFRSEYLSSLSETHVVRTKDDEAKFLSNYEDKLASDKTRDIATSIESDIYNASGVEKTEGEKYYDYLKRVVSDLKGKAGRVKGLESKLEELKNSGVDEETKRELTELKELIPKLKSEHETQLMDLKKKHDTDRKRSEIMSSLSEVALDPSLPEDVAKVMKANAVEKLLNLKSSFSDGKLIYVNDSGDTVRHEESLEPKSSKDLLIESLSSILKKQEQTTKGLGTNTDDSNVNAKMNKPDGVKTKIQLDTYIKESLGHANGSAEYTKAFQEMGGHELPVRL